MRQSEMWNDRDGHKLLHLKVHQVTLRAIEEWTGLDFGELKNVDELAWSEQHTRALGSQVEPEWPMIRKASDIVFSGATRRARGSRALRNASVTAQPGGSPRGRWMPPSNLSARLASDGSVSDCGCGTTGQFDAQGAIASLNREIVRLTDMVIAKSRLGVAPAGPSASAADAAAPSPMHNLRAVPADATGTVASPGLDQRINETVARTPDDLKDKMRSFMIAIGRQDQIARGEQAPAPAELEKIIGGLPVPSGAIPSCCCIGNASQWFCTGVVVAPQVVLTAAHCGRDITRVMVRGNRVLPWLDPNGLIIPVRQANVHPQYRAALNENDINVVILAAPSQVPPVAIATAQQVASAQEVELVGFGYNDPQKPIGFGEKRQVTAPVMPSAGRSKSELAELESHFGYHGDYEFVAGRKGLGRDTCNGDSGGPAYINTNAGKAVAGLTSRATLEATDRNPCGWGGIYVRPDMFMDWINSVLSAAGLSPL